MLDEDFTLNSGIGRSLAFKIHASIPGDHKEPPTVDLKAMKFWVVDSFGGKHRVPLSLNQTQEFDVVRS